MSETVTEAIGHVCLACDNPVKNKQGEQSDFCDECVDHHNAVFCQVCNETMCDEWPCDHLIWNSEIGDFIGCGSDEQGSDSYHREGLFAVLDAAPDMAGRLRRSVRRHDYRMYERGPIIGTSTLVMEFGRTDFGGRFWPDRGMSHQAEVGLAWLYSLEPRVTRRAEKLTVHWIDQWNHQQHKPGAPRRRRGRLADAVFAEPARAEE